ncbi:MAG: hypothetical protein F6K03_04285, partial [Kamptonema sp. SIO4C4]|nr:hypothetical protein [Kamptonema sp. SIO4C4]
MNGHRSAQIQQIIEQRRPLAARVQGVEDNLRELADQLRHLKAHRDSLLAKIEDPDIVARLQELDTTTLLSDIESELAALGKLQCRFARNTLNIGVVGRAGQGKSRLLQSLSGLTTVEIPTGDRSHCTGVRSTIHHNPSADTYGEITFHSERSFLAEVIAPYYDKLQLGIRPLSLDEFARHPLPPLPETAKTAELGAMYEHLKDYHQNLDKYRHLLREPSPRRISRQEIREYVAQDNEQGDRVYFNYLAVREAKIICSFPNQDVGQIALIDMPGLGDTGLGDEQRLIQILGQDVDIVLFIRLPRPPREYWADVDVQLYDIAKSALTSLPLEQWSFLVLNRTTATSAMGDNGVYCQDLVNALPSTHIEVIDSIIANCSDTQEANEKVLDRVLTYLTQEINSLDRQYSTTRQEALEQLHRQVETHLEKARKVLGTGSGKEIWFSTFLRMFNELWEDLTTGLEGLLKELRENRDRQDADFKEQVEKALQSCEDDPGLPSLAEIDKKRNAKGGYPNAYYDYLNEIRAHLSQKFLSLDDGLKRSLDRVKCQVADVLIEEGKLGQLSQQQGAAFLSEITQLIPEELRAGEPNELKRGFAILDSFELYYRGLIQHRIRQHLDQLTPDDSSLQLSEKPSAQEVLDLLKSAQSEAVYNCRNALDDLLAEPSQAAFAIVEEFLDRVLRAKLVK